MYGIPFPGIPHLLLTATHLDNLNLSGIPDSGYIPAEAIATCLSVLTNLRTLSLNFLFPLSRPDWESQPLPPTTRSSLSCLDGFWFTGASEYLDDLVAWIDAPRLHILSISFFEQFDDFDNPHLVQFIGRTPRFQEPNEAHLRLEFDAIVLLWESDDHGRLSVTISCEDSDPHPLDLAQVCTMCLPSLPTVESLQLGVFSKTLYSELEWKDGVEDDQWLELLRPFTAVKSLYLSKEFQPDIAAALQELVGERATEVLPSLQNIFLAKIGSFHETIGQFIAARQLSGHPIAVLPL